MLNIKPHILLIYHHAVVFMLTWMPACASTVSFMFSGCAHYAVSL